MALRTAAFATALLALAPLSAHAQSTCPTRASWPTRDWPSRAAEVAQARPDAVRALEDYAFTRVGQDEERKGIRTDAVLIVQGGAIVYEKYAPGWSATKRHLGWSMSKSVTETLAGLAVREGALSLSDSVCKWLPDTPEENCGVTVNHLLTFSSGFDWNETYENEANQFSSVLAMLYGVGHADMARFTAAHPLRDAPGTTWNYSTGETTLLAAVVQKALEPRLGKDFPWELLFDPIGMSNATWERDQKGTLVGGSYVYATARDWARYGFLYLNDGCWAGQRLLPDGWVKASTTVVPEFRTRFVEEPPDAPEGRLWWLNQAVPEMGIALPWPHVPGDAYAARGHWGQSVTVIPSLDLVVVRVADDREHTFEADRFLSLAIALGRAN